MISPVDRLVRDTALVAEVFLYKKPQMHKTQTMNTDKITVIEINMMLFMLD